MQLEKRIKALLFLRFKSALKHFNVFLFESNCFDLVQLIQFRAAQKHTLFRSRTHDPAPDLSSQDCLELQRQQNCGLRNTVSWLRPVLLGSWSGLEPAATSLFILGSGLHRETSMQHGRRIWDKVQTENYSQKERSREKDETVKTE